MATPQETLVTEAALADSLDGYAAVLTGSGSPIGVVTPQKAGIRYVDTAKTAGAEEWRATGTLSTSWQVTAGDTGWRNISGYLANGWTGTLYALRTTTDIEFAFEGVDGRAATKAAITSILPDGFITFPSPIPRRREVASSTNALMRIYMHPGRYLQSASFGSILPTELYGGFTYKTNSPWPAVRPGMEVA